MGSASAGSAAARRTPLSVTELMNVQSGHCVGSQVSDPKQSYVADRERGIVVRHDARRAAPHELRRAAIGEEHVADQHAVVAVLGDRPARAGDVAADDARPAVHSDLEAVVRAPADGVKPIASSVSATNDRTLRRARSAPRERSRT